MRTLFPSIDTWMKLREYDGNPLMEPLPRSWLIADPTVVPPTASPDGRWHLFANSVTGIHRFTSFDGFEWEHLGRVFSSGIRPCVRNMDALFYLYYERFVAPGRSVVSVRTSEDLRSWGPPQDLLEPLFDWEGRWLKTNGNPCLTPTSEGYLLYFSSSYVFLRDCLYWEPGHIGVAIGESPLGPFRKHPHPIISPDADAPWCNLAAGALKVYPTGEGFVGLHTTLYRDTAGRSRACVRLLSSTDGIDWKEIQAPLLAPNAGTWTHGFVYAVEATVHGGKLYCFFNARDGWLIGRERIGLAVADM